MENVLASVLTVCYSYFSPPCLVKSESKSRQVLQMLIRLPTGEFETKSNKSALVLEATVDEKFSGANHRENSGTETSPCETPEFHYLIRQLANR